MKQILIAGLITLTLSVDNALAQSRDDWPSPIPNEYFGQVLFDRLEYTRTDEQQNIGVWDMQAWYGGDYHRLVFKSEGENTQNDGMPTDLERAELLYGYLVSSFGLYNLVWAQRESCHQMRIWRTMRWSVIKV